MKAPKAICAAIVLALALSVPAYAGDGDILIPGYTPPPPPPPPPITVTEPTPDSPDLSTLLASTLGDMTSGYADILWVFASIF